VRIFRFYKAWLTHQSISTINSISNPLHILQEHLLAAAVIELRGPAIGVTGYSLSGFKGAIIFQKICDTGRPK
jgi:hypothetical protein